MFSRSTVRSGVCLGAGHLPGAEKIGLTCVFMRTPKKGVVVRRHPEVFRCRPKKGCASPYTTFLLTAVQRVSEFMDTLCGLSIP